MRRAALTLSFLFAVAAPAAADVTAVTIASRTPFAEGRVFGSVGTYERLVGKIAFSLDPADPRNRGIADLEFAPRGADGRVHFSSDLIVLRPTDPAKGNGVLLFEVANRGRRVLLTRFNRARGSPDPTVDADAGDGLLMRDGYTLVWVGWEADVAAPLLRVEAPRAQLPAGADDRLSVELVYNQRQDEAFLIDDPAGRPPVIYPPVDPVGASDVLTVRDRFWQAGEVVPRDRWRFVAGPNGVPKLRLDGGFDPGRYYRVTYRATGALVAGVGLAAIRDAAAAFRHRTDLPIQGRAAYAFGISQAGRFLRQFLYDGFNADERGRRVFDAAWVHIGGAARGSFNERLAIPTHGDAFRPTAFPFTDAEQSDVDGRRGGIQSRYRPEQRPKVFYTNTPVEYWGGGRAAALQHTSIDGRRDLAVADNVRIYVLASAQHIEVPFPPPPRGQAAATAAAGAASRNDGQQLVNTTPQSHVMRALLRALHAWAANGTAPPASRYPRLADETLVPIRNVAFPAIPGVADPRGIEGPARMMNGTLVPLPHLVPQVDADGNDRAGIRVPEIAVPLATTTGWNFRDPAVGNPGVIYQLLGSYVPFASTKAAREATRDPRPSIEERYRVVDDYLQRIRTAAQDLVRERLLLDEDIDPILDRAKTHWTYATASQPRLASPAVAAADGPASKRMADGKEWTRKNLDVEVAPSFCYDEAAENCRKYGRLYPWASAQRACLALGDRWRLPTNDEWRALGVAYGGLREDTADKGRAAFDALIAGGPSGFDIVFGGGRTDKSLEYQRIDAHGFYWTATETGAATAWFYNFGRNGVSMNRHVDGEKLSAFAVRCIRD